MVTKKDIKQAYNDFTTEFKPKIEDFNDRKGSFKLNDLVIRVTNTNYHLKVTMDKAALFLGIGDLAEQVQKSRLYNLLVDSLKENNYQISTHPFLFKDKNDKTKLSIVEYYGTGNWEEYLFTIFTVHAYKEITPTEYAGGGTTLLWVENDLKIKMCSLSEIMSHMNIPD